MAADILLLQADKYAREAQFHRDRITDLRAGAVGFPKVDAPFTVAHLLPLGRLDTAVDLSDYENRLRDSSGLFPAELNARFNFDGYAISPAGGTHKWHTQWFRFGGVEIFTSDLHGTEGGEKMYQAEQLARLLDDRLETILGALTDSLQVQPPFGLFLTITDVDKHRLSFQRRPVAGESHVIDRRELKMPPVCVEGSGRKQRDAVSLLLDILWQSAGFAKAPRERWVGGGR